MFRIKQKSVVVVTVIAVAAGSLAAAASASPAAKRPLQQQARPAATFIGEASLDDTGLLELDVSQVVAARGAGALLVGREARLLTGSATRIANLQGGPVARALLDHALVRVLGRLVPVSAWTVNEEGERVPTIRVARIVVLQTDSETEPAQDGVEVTDQD